MDELNAGDEVAQLALLYESCTTLFFSIGSR